MGPGRVGVRLSPTTIDPATGRQSQLYFGATCRHVTIRNTVPPTRPDRDNWSSKPRSRVFLSLSLSLSIYIYSWPAEEQKTTSSWLYLPSCEYPLDPAILAIPTQFTHAPSAASINIVWRTCCSRNRDGADATMATLQKTLVFLSPWRTRNTGKCFMEQSLQVWSFHALLLVPPPPCIGLIWLDGNLPELAGGFTPSSAARCLEDGHYDLIAFGRWFISNPDLPARIKNGDSNCAPTFEDLDPFRIWAAFYTCLS